MTGTFELPCPACNAVLRRSRNKKTIFRNDAAGVTCILDGKGRPCFSAAVLSDCPNCRTPNGNVTVQYHHDDEKILESLDVDERLLYPCDPRHCFRHFRPCRNMVSQLVESVMKTDMGFSAYQATLSVAHAEEMTRAHLAYSAAVKKIVKILRANVCDDAWGLLSETQKQLLEKARTSISSIRAAQEKGQRAFGKYDDTAGAFGKVPLDEGTIRSWLNTEFVFIKPFGIREQQAADVPPEHAAAFDACPRLGKAAQIPGAGKKKRSLALLTAGYHQRVCPMLVENGAYGEIKKGVRQGVAARRWRMKALSADDHGAAVSWHAGGETFEEDIPTLLGVPRDPLHQINQISRTQVQFSEFFSKPCYQQSLCFPSSAT